MVKQPATKKTLWQPSGKAAEWIDDFTAAADRNLDLHLARFDIIGTLAHCRMLHKIGLLRQDELEKISETLTGIYREVLENKFHIEQGVEDIHSQIELTLTRQIGDTGKKIHTGRSRNDQILLDLRLFIRDFIRKMVHETDSLFTLLIDLSERHKKTFLPGYSHMQAAMPSSFGLWFAAYAESLIDDLNQLHGAYRIINKNPLGSAAGYGTSLPLDRQLTTDLLAFDELNYNAVYAQMGRGRTERILSQAMSSFAETLGKLATDIILFMSDNYRFVSFPEELTTGSSIMPHKRNPDVFELIRGRCNRIKNLPGEIMMICTNLPHGYHRDFQIIKESLIPRLTDLINCIIRMHTMLSSISVNRKIKRDSRYKILGTVEAVNQLVLKGIPFRDAYNQVAAQIRQGTFKPPRNITYTHIGSSGNLCNDRLIRLKDATVRSFQFKRLDKMLDLLI